MWADEDDYAGAEQATGDAEADLQDVLDVEAAIAMARPCALRVAAYYQSCTLIVTPDVAIILALAFQNTLLATLSGGQGQVQGGSNDTAH
jgi:hypothetical protein